MPLTPRLPASPKDVSKMSDSVDANYARAYSNKIGFGKKPALILVDFAQAYFDPDQMTVVSLGPKATD